MSQLELFPDEGMKEIPDKKTPGEQARMKYGNPVLEAHFAKLEEQAAKEKEEKAEKARARKAENEEYKDKRTKASPLVQKAEVEKMREILGRGKGGGGMGGGADLEGKMGGKALKKNYKSGGKVTASSRADGCAMRGKTKGRMI